MKYNENTGIIYDIVNYGVICFNRDTIEGEYQEKGYKQQDAFTYYDEVKNKCGPVSDCLLPFFYYDREEPCFMINFFKEHANFHEYTVEDFIESLKDKKTLKKEIFNYLFKNLEEEEIEKIIRDEDGPVIDKAVRNQLWPSGLKHEVIFLLFKFDYVAEHLIESLSEIRVHMAKLHKKYKDIIKYHIEGTHSKENLILFERLYSLNEKKANKQFFSLSFMNQFLRMSKSDRREESVFLFGVRYKETMEADCNQSNVSLENALVVLGDPVRYRIVECLKKYGKLTSSDLSRLTNISTSTAFRGVNRLAEERMIREDHKNSRKIYLSINQDYFDKLVEIFSVKFKNINNLDLFERRESIN